MAGCRIRCFRLKEEIIPRQATSMALQPRPRPGCYQSLQGTTWLHPLNLIYSSAWLQKLCANILLTLQLPRPRLVLLQCLSMFHPFTTYLVEHQLRSTPKGGPISPRHFNRCSGPRQLFTTTQAVEDTVALPGSLAGSPASSHCSLPNRNFPRRASSSPGSSGGSDRSGGGGDRPPSPRVWR